MNLSRYEVAVDKLRWRCDPDMFDFECTEDLTPLGEFIGQDRAIRAIEFGLSMAHDGYNIYVAGLSGTGKTSVVKSYIQKLVEERQIGEEAYKPGDWCYVYNFADPDRPEALDLPQGKGRVFEEQVNNLLLAVRKELAKAFASEDYKEERQKLLEEGQAEQQRLFAEVGEEAQRQGFLIQMTPAGPAVIPVADGKPISQADYMALKESERKVLDEKRMALLKKLQDIFEKAQEMDRETAEKLRDNDRKVGNFVISRLFDTLLKKYKGVVKVTGYLAALKSYTLDNLDAFKEPSEPVATAFGMPVSYSMAGRDVFLPFKVNVFVDNSGTSGPPVIIESNPNYANLFGKIERRFLLGGYLSDHTMLKPGALHLANGGYLLLNAVDVLSNPGVWVALKRAIKTEEARLEDPFEQFGLIAPQGLRPQPIPIDVKIVLIGDAMLYQMLAMYDEDFWEIFRVKADFDYEVARTEENMKAFAAFIAGCCEDCKLKHFDRTAVATVMEYTARMVADQDKMSSRFSQIKELVREAEYWARKEGASLVSAKHVERAVEEKLYRHNLPDEKMRDMIERGTIMIDVAGSVVGQVNGLAVYSLGDVVFGKPSRITCKTFLGRDGVINIERESKLSGKTHDKGVLILGGYMGWKYAQDNPLSLSASLCFEQSYQGVDGDSASSTELYALLSSLSGMPVKQGIAVTGSVNQKGEVQPIGGVNQKIEGFYQVCKAKGLSGEQGVMIPGQNIRNLMLMPEVVSSVEEGKFHIYAVNNVDEGIEILTGVRAGEREKDGTFPEDTVNRIVDKQLKEMATRLRQFAAPAAGDKKKKANEG